MNKRGALELSVTGVVVLIIAIVVLGSVIFFIRSFFGQTTELIGGQLESVKEQLRDTIRSTGEPIVLDFGKNLELKQGRPQQIFLGVRNDFTNPSGDSDVCYIPQIVCRGSFTDGRCGLSQVFDNTGGPSDPCIGEPQDAGPVAVGGIGVNQNADVNASQLTRYTACETTKWVSQMLTLWDVPNRETDVLPVTFQVSGARSDTYQMELRIFVPQGNVDCQAVRTSSTTTPLRLWQSKRFLIDLS